MAAFGADGVDRGSGGRDMLTGPYAFRRAKVAEYKKSWGLCDGSGERTAGPVGRRCRLRRWSTGRARGVGLPKGAGLQKPEIPAREAACVCC